MQPRLQDTLFAYKLGMLRDKIAMERQKSDKRFDVSDIANQLGQQVEQTDRRGEKTAADLGTLAAIERRPIPTFQDQGMTLASGIAGRNAMAELAAQEAAARQKAKEEAARARAERDNLDFKIWQEEFNQDIQNRRLEAMKERNAAIESRPQSTTGPKTTKLQEARFAISAIKSKRAQDIARLKSNIRDSMMLTGGITTSETETAKGLLQDKINEEKKEIMGAVEYYKKKGVDVPEALYQEPEPVVETKESVEDENERLTIFGE